MHSRPNPNSGLASSLEVIQTASPAARLPATRVPTHGSAPSGAERIRGGPDTLFLRKWERWLIPTAAGAFRTNRANVTIQTRIFLFDKRLRTTPDKRGTFSSRISTPVADSACRRRKKERRDTDTPSGSLTRRVPIWHSADCADESALALATRHLEQPEPGNFQAAHQTVRGRISYSNGEVAFVIDGQLLTLQQFGKLVETFEGFEFRLDIRD